MGKLVLSIGLTLVVIYVVPFLVYSALTVFGWVKPPENVSPLRFLSSIFVSKVGTAITFVLIFYCARNALSGQWLVYAFLWWVMFVVGKVGQAIGPGYSWKEAVGGIISETIYCPLSAYVTHWLIGNRP